MRKDRLIRSLLVLAWLVPLLFTGGAAAQGDDPTPPSQPVKLIFIHHSTGQNWLTDDYGNLGKALAQNNYFVSDTNYGWGPNGIGDRTDIPNWLEWFRNEQTPAYMTALFKESGQNSSYTRTFVDPGGENTIVMFKSCFPNSALEGSPNDPPNPDGWLSVGHAKYVYNEILRYFATRPDRLFVVITAPPLSDRTYSANARAFNDWLMNDWLRENGYALNNVAVFDFYNVLTAKDAHHRYAGGKIEHPSTKSNTLAYPSGDDHPSVAGSQKATDEFIPLLNIFYHRWQAGLSQQPAAANTASPTPAAESTPVAESTALDETALLPAPAGVIDDFEAANKLSSGGWQGFRDEATDTRVTCAPAGDQARGGARALQIAFDVAPDSWITCVLNFDAVQDWSGSAGLAFYLWSEKPGLLFNVDIFAGQPGSTGTYAQAVEAPSGSASGWVLVSLRWNDFLRVAWEENGGTPLGAPQSITGIAFGFKAQPGARNGGSIWVDDLQLLGGEPVQVATATSTTAAAPAPLPTSVKPTAAAASGTRVGLCKAPVAVSLALVALAWVIRRRRLV